MAGSLGLTYIWVQRPRGAGFKQRAQAGGEAVAAVATGSIPVRLSFTDDGRCTVLCVYCIRPFWTVKHALRACVYELRNAHHRVRDRWLVDCKCRSRISPTQGSMQKNFIYGGQRLHKMPTRPRWSEARGACKDAEPYADAMAQTANTTAACKRACNQLAICASFAMHLSGPTTFRGIRSQCWLSPSPCFVPDCCHTI